MDSSPLLNSSKAHATSPDIYFIRQYDTQIWPALSENSESAATLLPLCIHEHLEREITMASGTRGEKATFLCL